MEKFTTIIKPLFNPVNGTPFVLGPQGPYSSEQEARTKLSEFYNGNQNIPNGQSVIISGKPYYFFNGSLKDITNEHIDISQSYVCELGNVEQSLDAENAAKEPNISGDNRINIIRYTVNSSNKSGLILQQVGSNVTIQILFWDGKMYRRDIHFTDETRSEIDIWYNLNWWTIGGTHIKWDHTTGKLGLCSLNDTIINEYHTAILRIGSGLEYNRSNQTLQVKLDDGPIKDSVNGLQLRTTGVFTIIPGTQALDLRISNGLTKGNNGSDIRLASSIIEYAGDSVVSRPIDAILIPNNQGITVKISTGLNVDDEGYLYIDYDRLAEALYTRMTNIAAAKASETE